MWSARNELLSAWWFIQCVLPSDLIVILHQCIGRKCIYWHDLHYSSYRLGYVKINCLPLNYLSLVCLFRSTSELLYLKFWCIWSLLVFVTPGLCTYPQRGWNLALQMYVDCSMQGITKTVRTLIFSAICTNMPETTVCPLIQFLFVCEINHLDLCQFLCHSLLLWWSSHDQPGRLFLINYCTWNTVPQKLHSPWFLGRALQKLYARKKLDSSPGRIDSFSMIFGFWVQ